MERDYDGKKVYRNPKINNHNLNYFKKTTCDFIGLKPETALDLV